MNNWLDKYSENASQAQKGKTIQATRQDSLQLYNNSINFENSIKKLGYKKIFSEKKSKEDYPTDLYKYNNGKVIINPELALEFSMKEDTRTDKKGDIYLKNTVPRTGNSRYNPNIKTDDNGRINSNKHPLLKKVGGNKYIGTEQSAFLGYNTDLPYLLLDGRIRPQLSEFYRLNAKEKTGDSVKFDKYDPLAVKPFDLLTTKEKEQRVKQYGRNGVPDSYGKPDATKVFTKPTKDTVNKQTDSFSSVVMRKPVRRTDINPIVPIKNEIDSKGLKVDNSSLTTDVQIQPKVRTPKSYKVEDTSNPSAGFGDGYGGSTSTYTTFDPSKLPYADKRKITPVYQNGQDIINASKDIPAITGTQFDTKKIVNYQPGVMSGNEPGFYLYSKNPAEGGFDVDRDREFIKQNEMLTVQRTPQWVEYMKSKAKAKPTQAFASYQKGGKVPVPRSRSSEIKEHYSREEYTLPTSMRLRKDTPEEIAQARKLKIAKSIEARKTPYTQDNWRKQLAVETSATGDKMRISDYPNVFDDYLNPAVWVGGMASRLGQAPYQAQQSDSYMPYVSAIGAPLAAGALGGLGTKSTGQFVNNMINPLAGLGDKIKNFSTKQLDKMFVQEPWPEPSKVRYSDFLPPEEAADLAHRTRDNYSKLFGEEFPEEYNNFMTEGIEKRAVKDYFEEKYALPESFPAHYDKFIEPSFYDWNKTLHPEKVEFNKFFTPLNTKKKSELISSISPYKNGGVIDDDLGQWKHPGEITRINSNNITMQGVNYPVLGVSDSGDTQMMYPGKDYKFKGKKVTEYPQIAKNGKELKKLDQLTNFTNYNTPQPGGWLDKY